MKHIFGITLGAACLLATSNVRAQTINPANGNYYQAVAGAHTWDSAKALADSMSHNGLRGHLATIR